MIEAIILTPPTLGGGAVELFVAIPNGVGPHPAILFVHGHQLETPRPGGRVAIDTGRIAGALSRGFAAAAVSMPGYGASDGPPDFCGPRTQAAVRAALACLREQPTVDAKRLVLWGRSRGAITSGMVAMQEPDLAALVLVAGVYDLASAYPTPIEGINELIRLEAGTSSEAFAARSALQHAERIRMPTAILHGADDERAPAFQAQALYDQLRSFGADAKLIMLSGEKHGFDMAMEEVEAYAFIVSALERRES